MTRFSRKITHAWLTVIGLSMLLSACNGGGDVATINTTLFGNSFKGPVDAASVVVTDEAGKVLAKGQSVKGKFSFPALILPTDGQAIYIISQSGNYTDEATGSLVNVGSARLMTVFTAVNLKVRIANSSMIVLTPETTLMALLVKDLVAKGVIADAAITQAKNTIQTQLIDGTSPMPRLPGDTLQVSGDFTLAVPNNQTESFARNRAISFSYETQTLRLKPVQVFELVKVRALDLQDGVLDGLQNSVRLSLTDQYGTVIALDKMDQRNSYKAERARLFNHTVNKFTNNNNAVNQAALIQTQQLLTAINLPAFQHLPVLVDEDGNLNDAYATFTFTATDHVNVTINAPGKSWTTPMMRYNGMQLPPVVRANRGDAMTLNLVNTLATDTTIHWHGFKIPGAQDGGPDFPVAAAASKTYRFTMQQPAAPLWFHPHPDMKTGEQVYRGLAGVFLLDDAITKQLEANNQLPSGAVDIPILVQDRSFNADVYGNGVRTLFYQDMMNGGGMEGMLASDILVNGSVLPQLSVGTRQYRFRLYNTSNARTYNFALSDGAMFMVIATDGGLLPKPIMVSQIKLSPAERAEIVIDFSKYTVGTNVMLVSKPFGGAMMGGANNTGVITPPANGVHLDVMRFDVTQVVADSVTLYTSLPNHADINTQRLTAADSFRTRNFVMSMLNVNGSMTFVFNNRLFDMARIDETITLAQGNTEIWSIQNMTPMAHPFHAHAIQWQILDRSGVAASGVDLGWKDTVLVHPGETVRFIGRFDPVVNFGDYMYHCHILEHEDAGMMGFFRIQ